MGLFEYKGKSVEFIAKPIKHCYLRIKPNGVVTLTHNKYLKTHDALKLLENNWSSILNKLSKLAPVEENNLEHGSMVYFLGQQYTLQVVISKQHSIELIGNFMYLFVANDTQDLKDKLIRTWYINQAKVILAKQYYVYLNNVASWKIVTPQLKFRTMKRRWGSYNKKTNMVTLNTELVKASPQIINYIIAHELCHILHFNHSKDFYNCLTTLHPSWREEKRELDSLTFKYLNQCN